MTGCYQGMPADATVMHGTSRLPSRGRRDLGSQTFTSLITAPTSRDALTYSAMSCNVPFIGKRGKGSCHSLTLWTVLDFHCYTLDIFTM